MLILDRYIGKTVLLAMLVVLLVLAGLDFIFTFFDEVGETHERYSVLDALTYVLLTFPRHIYELLPMTVLIGALIGLGVLASGNELAVMQAAGIQVKRIVWSVMKPTAVVMLLGLCLGEFIAPPLETRAEVSKSLAQGDEIIWSASGYWQRDNNDYIYFNSLDPAGVLYALNIYSYDDEQRLQQNIIADTAHYQGQVGGESRWLLENVNLTTYQRGEGGVDNEVENLETMIWGLNLSPELLQVMLMDSDKIAISDLYLYAQQFQAQGQDADPYFLSFWKKVMQPLTAGVLVLVAVSFIFGPLREATMGSRVFSGVLFGLVFIIFQRLFGTVSLVYEFNPFFAVLLPILLSALVGFYMLRKAA